MNKDAWRRPNLCVALCTQESTSGPCKQGKCIWKPEGRTRRRVQSMPTACLNESQYQTSCGWLIVDGEWRRELGTTLFCEEKQRKKTKFLRVWPVWRTEQEPRPDI